VYDYEHPDVVHRNGLVELIFDQAQHDLLDAPFYVVQIDPCQQRVIDTFETDAWLRKRK
jgi:hypothetical protein